MSEGGGVDRRMHRLLPSTTHPDDVRHFPVVLWHKAVEATRVGPGCLHLASSLGRRRTHGATDDARHIVVHLARPCNVAARLTTLDTVVPLLGEACKRHAAPAYLWRCLAEPCSAELLELGLQDGVADKGDPKHVAMGRAPCSGGREDFSQRRNGAWSLGAARGERRGAFDGRFPRR